MNRFPEIRVFIEQDNLLASSTALSLAKLAVEYHNLSILTHMRDYESENVRVARHLHGQFSSVDQRTFYGSQNGPKMYICGKAVCARSHLSALDRPLKQSLGQVMVSTRGQESRRITYTHMIPKLESPVRFYATRDSLSMSINRDQVHLADDYRA